MKKTIIMILMAAALSLGVLCACESREDKELKAIFTESARLTVDMYDDFDATEGLSATLDGRALSVVAEDYSDKLNKVGNVDITCYAFDGTKKVGEYVRHVNVTYFGMTAERLGATAPSSATQWTFRNTVPIVTGNEWQRCVLNTSSPVWNRFEDSAGLVMHGSDTNGHTEGSEDDLPNTVLYNRFTLDKTATKMTVYLSNNPYPDYNNMAVNYRFVAITLDDFALHCLTPWTTLEAPVPSKGTIDTSWYRLLQEETFVDVDVSALAGREIIFMIQQDSAPLNQRQFVAEIGFKGQYANEYIKESRDTLVIYDVMIHDNSVIVDGLSAKQWSAMPVSDRTEWDLSLVSDADDWEIVAANGCKGTKTVDGCCKAAATLTGDGKVYLVNKLYAKGDRLLVTASDNLAASLVLPTREIVALTPLNREAADGKVTYTYDIGVYLSMQATVMFEVQTSLELYSVALQNVNGKILWTIGDSIFHINYDMVSDIASQSHCALVTRNLSGTTVSPCRMKDECMVTLIKNGTFEEMFWEIKPTVILVERGINDLYECAMNQSIALGNADSHDEGTSVCGAVNYCIDWLQSSFPEARIIWCSPMWSAATEQGTIEQYNELLREICQKQQIEFVDLYNGTGIGKTNYSMYLYDGTHPNEYGKEVLRQLLVSAINKEEQA